MMQTFTGIDYLKIDIANNFGLDKKKWNERLDWFNDNEHQLDSLIKQAEEPALYFAGVQAYRKTQAGKPSNYPISLDATCSGIQILAALTGDRKAASLCNVVDTGEREDAYTSIYEHMCAAIGDEAKIDRKDTKKAIMTSFYSSKSVPKMVFGEGKLLDVFYDTLKEQAPGAWELNEAMLALWDPEAYSNDWILPDNFHVHIKVMGTKTENVHFLNKPYEVSYTVNEPMEGGRSLGANMTHSIDGMIVREMGRRCMYDPNRINAIFRDFDNYSTYGAMAGKDDRHPDSKMVIKLWNHYLQSGFLSARILDHLSIHNMGHVDKLAIFDMIATLPENPFQVISIHDCFRCLPNYGNDLRKQYNILLSNIAKSNLLSYILTQITKRPMNVGKLDDSMWVDILETNYALS